MDRETLTTMLNDYAHAHRASWMSESRDPLLERAAEDAKQRILDYVTPEPEGVRE